MQGQIFHQNAKLKEKLEEESQKRKLDDDEKSFFTSKSEDRESKMSGAAKSLAHTMLSGSTSLIDTKVEFDDETERLFMSNEEIERREIFEEDDMISDVGSEQMCDYEMKVR